MSKDTIYREDAIKAIFSKPACHGSDGSWYHSDDIRDAINSIPSADRPQGEWIHAHEGTIAEGLYCSNCGKHGYGEKDCPNCGAIMKGVDDE